MTRDILLNNLCPTDTTFDCWNGDEICNCDDCNRVLNKWLDEYDKQIRAKAINDYYNKLNEKINTDTRLNDTIREIHDNVAHEMYCKGIDDFVNACKENISCQTFGLHIKGIERIAEQLKAGGKNESRRIS